MISSFPIPATHYKQIAHWNIRSIYFHNFCIVWLFAILPLFSVLHFTPACLLKKCNILWGKGIFTNSSISIFEKKWENFTKLRRTSILYSETAFSLFTVFSKNIFGIDSLLPHKWVSKQYLSIISSVLLLQKLYLDSDRFSLTLL